VLDRVAMGQIFYQCFGFSFSVSFHQCSILIHQFITDAMKDYQLTVSLNSKLGAKKEETEEISDLKLQNQAPPVGKIIHLATSQHSLSLFCDPQIITSLLFKVLECDF
jgi:hypothetical protein